MENTTHNPTPAPNATGPTTNPAPRRPRGRPRKDAGATMPAAWTQARAEAWPRRRKARRAAPTPPAARACMDPNKSAPPCHGLDATGAGFAADYKAGRAEIMRRAMAEAWPYHRKAGAITGLRRRLLAHYQPTPTALAKADRDHRRKCAKVGALPRGRKPHAYRQALALADTLADMAATLRKLAHDLDGRRAG